MDFRILGPLEVAREDGGSIGLEGRQQRVVLAMLLLHANEVVSVDQLIDVLWGERPPTSAVKTVQILVSRVRKALEQRSTSADETPRPILHTRGSGYVLEVAPGELDVDRFEGLLEEGRQGLAAGDAAKAGATLRAALTLWRGRPLSDFAYESFAQSEIGRLDELRLAALEERIDADLAVGLDDDLVPELRALVTEHPLRDRLRGQLMLALYRSGRQPEALRVYEEARRALAEELGLEPSAILQRLQQSILTEDETLGAPVRESAPSSTARVERAPVPGITKRARVLLSVGGVLVLAAALAVGALALTRDRTSGGLSGIGPNSVGVIDPETNEIVAVIPVGLRPGPVAAGAGAVWVGNLQDRNLTKIDPRERSAAGVVPLGGRTPTGLAVGAGAVWVAHGPAGQLSRVETQFRRVTQTLDVTERLRITPFGSVAIGQNEVWTAYGDSTLARIDPTAVRPTGSTLAGSSPAAVAIGGGAVWVVNSGDATVQGFDPVTFEEGPIRTISVGRRPTAIAYGQDALWVTAQGGDAVVRIDPSSPSTITIPVGDEPGAVAVGAGAVWVANRGDGTVSRIDPTTNTPVETIEIGTAPAGIAVADGFVWVTAQAQ
jgi:YVTN family beta-propeller protein